MAEQTNKRYIVTFNDEQVSQETAVKVLGVPKKNVKDGLEYMATDTIPHTSEILHFETIGVSALSLTESQAKTLQDDAQVAEVVEDFEVYALGCSKDDWAEGNYRDHLNMDDYGTIDFESDNYMKGYQQAVYDLYYADEGGSGYEQSSFSPSQFPTEPFPPGPLPPYPGFPRLPIPYPPFLPICPPGYVRIGRRCVRLLPPPKQPIPWNISMIGANRVWSRVTGRGVKVAILDTGIDNDHPDLSVTGGVSFVPGVASWDDDNKHGTHCAGIVAARNNLIGIVGVAPDASLFAVKVLNAGGSGQLSWILAGMSWAAQNKMDIVSMSLGSLASSSDATCVLAYQRAAQVLDRAGCLVVAAAGNSGPTNSPWVGQPARCPGFMAVAAVDQNRQLASFSSHGPATLCPDCGVEIAAPGVSVRSTVPGGGYQLLSGTSMACPHVSGAAALLRQLHPTLSPSQIRRHLRNTASDLGAPGNDERFGAGLLNCFRAIFG